MLAKAYRFPWAASISIADYVDTVTAGLAAQAPLIGPPDLDGMFFLLNSGRSCFFDFHCRRSSRYGFRSTVVTNWLSFSGKNDGDWFFPVFFCENQPVSPCMINIGLK